MSYALETKNLTKEYDGYAAVDQVSMHVNEGTIYGFVGSNGAGKSTFMKMIAGMVEQDSGSITLFGESDIKTARRSMGVMIEEPGYYPHLSAYENLKVHSMMFGFPLEQIMPILTTVGLSGTDDKPVKDYSLGMRQRMGIAIALLGQPAMLMLDEPLNGLDPQAIADMRELLVSLREAGITILISSHLLDELHKVADDYGIIKEGKLILETSGDYIDTLCEKKGISFEACFMELMGGKGIE